MYRRREEDGIEELDEEEEIDATRAALLAELDKPQPSTSVVKHIII